MASSADIKFTPSVIASIYCKIFPSRALDAAMNTPQVFGRQGLEFMTTRFLGIYMESMARLSISSLRY